MTRTLTLAIAALMLAISSNFIVADDGNQVQTHRLTVEEKLTLIETIEITSEKELQEPTEKADPIVDAILDEITQLESELESSEDSST